MTMTATYSPEDNALRLYATTRLDAETYKRVKEAGFRWAPQQELFKAPMWTPAREDLLLELCGSIDDEDTSLVERAEARAERFEDYSEKRATEAGSTHKAVESIMRFIPPGQPLLVNHHSYKHALKDKERIENGLRKAVSLWRTSQYWTDRAAGALRHAKYKERPDVRARRIKTLEADLRKYERNYKDAATKLRLWSQEGLTLAQAQQIANFCHVIVCETDGSRWSAWDVLRPDADRYTRCPAWTVDQVVAHMQTAYPPYLAICQRWIEHYTNRISYERALLETAGGIAADQVRPEKGGACKCWVGRLRQEWTLIQKVNKVSVTVEDNWGNNGTNFTRTVPITDLQALMSKADVEAYRAEGRLQMNAYQSGFWVLSEPSL
jgi:hypothetical protein